ncbi:hypothetical protein FNV62_25215 [Streptomyces sp. RLB3-17]|uniref:hypothetical protein n=1 Tax=unclassified Streptomyces TaxID=2593676 RepID=UPI001163CD6B|nr:MULTISPECIES: hypothetical protein [unclassified Streptomyces]QDN99253.1 hypothetical protein FNV58_27590 [Streptomyces sp. RLB1-9]QDO20968.1 hypothetical protein FNV65_26085 [Streptomyces sp. S1A1-8]QDO31093.1 hypothetical protein FNV63_26105 [Streptomyces sp. S1A1-3]QDO41009.1 hypothetical protein FNV62_25215 [Streptomyces sp. RLB3-17]
MSDQPYEGRYEGPYEGYDPYPQPQQQQRQGHGQPQQHQPQQQPEWPQHTQQWEGQTWETQVQPSMPAADTTYLPPQGYQAYPEPQTYGTVGQPLPQEAPAPTPEWTPAYQPPVQQAHGTGTGGVVTPDSASGYGPPTVTGNARVTDAQRARAEGRSPIIEPGLQPAVLTAVLGLLLSGTAAIGQYALVVPLVLLQAVTAAGWFRLNGMWPARQGIALAFLGAVTADVALLAAGRENAPAAILGTLGVWVLLTLVLQLRSHADPDTRMYGLMATVASAALAIIATGHLAAEPDAVTVGAAAVAVAILARALPLPTAASVVVALLAAAGAGIAVGGMTDLGSKGAFLGLGAGVCALIGHRVASYDYPSRFVHFTAGVALPLAAAAPAVYLLGRALG